MNMHLSLRNLLITASLGGLFGVGQACVITVGPLDCTECGNTGCHSQEVNGECKCDSGYEWASPNDPDDYECDRIPTKGGDANCGGIEDNPIHMEGGACVCDAGFNWCEPDDLDDLSCCEDEDQAPPTGGEVETDDGDMTDGDTDADDTSNDETADVTGDPPPECLEEGPPWNGIEPDPAECTEDGLVFCSNTEAEGPAGSRYWECVGGEWVENTTAGDESCQFDGFQFAYGCIDDGSVTFICGDGPGTACNGPECNGCAADGDGILFCTDGKLGGDSCNRICTEVGDDRGITYDYGECVMIEGGGSECACCDSGEEGCPV